MGPQTVLRRGATDLSRRALLATLLAVSERLLREAVLESVPLWRVLSQQFFVVAER
jgi:hypothetical protein